MACIRCGNTKWAGPFPICDQCGICPTCKGARLNATTTSKCEDCNGIGWKYLKPPPPMKNDTAFRRQQ